MTLQTIEALQNEETFAKVADLIAQLFEIDRETIKPESQIIKDLELDSLDWMDLVFEIPGVFGVHIPYEQWTQDVNADRVPAVRYFTMAGMCNRIDELVAATASCTS